MADNPLISESETLTASQVTLKLKDYSIGCKTITGLKIEHIYGKSDTFIVFLCDNKRVHWEFDGEDEDGFTRAIAEYQALRNTLPIDVPKTTQENLINNLALSLYNAIQTGDIDSSFKAIRERIGTLLTPNQAKLRLILFSLLSACFMGSCLLLLFISTTWSHNIVFVASGAGIIGAVFSLMQRNRKVEIPQDNGDFYIFLQAFFVCVLGAIAGGMIYIIANSSVITLVTDENIYNLLLFSIVAGFSERTVPDLFNGISNADNPKPPK
jgi:hypothetical protein